MSKLLISLLFLLIWIYTIIVLWMYFHEWKEKRKWMIESIEQEKTIDLQQIEINNLKHNIAKLKESLYNEDKEEKSGRNKNNR